ncbi:MAG: SDR family oxidoreductase [Candidatus Thiodiazotropha taylori]|nr:SDR family oxidoreductase [Candidatus Thiodiazotropha taylori]MCG7908441.1 SDR family oxidoreductase [Candidatus Thiodiazotropha taylori]
MAQQIDFSGQSVLVVGGTSGINLGIAEAFAANGARVAVVGRSRERMERALSLLSASGGEAIGRCADVRDLSAVEQVIGEISDHFGGIDVLVSGAAGNFPASALDMSPAGFSAVVDIDLLGSYHVLRTAYAYLSKPGACVINISAPQAYIPMPLQLHVCAAKAGVDMLTRVLAMEWGESGVRVNSIVPGPIADTEGMKRLAPTAEARAMITDSVPLKRLGKAGDVANLALFLASPMASYITGAVMPVDGGWSLGGLSAMALEMQRHFKPGGRD